MSRLNYNESGLTGTVNTLIDRATGKLSFASITFLGIKIPSDFSQAGTVRGASGRASQISRKLKEAKGAINDSVNRFKRSEQQSQADVNNLLSSLGTIGSYMDPKESAKTVERTKKNAKAAAKKAAATVSSVGVAIGKGAEGRVHGIKGAQKAEEFLRDAYSSDDMAIIQSAIEYHSIGDSEEAFQQILKKYGVAPDDEDIARRVSNALKDADALDRSRFPGNLNADYLRTDTGQSMVKATHQLQEAKAKEYLDNMLAGNISSSDKATIEALRKTELSDYEISFWIQYQPSAIGGRMGVWDNVDRVVQGVLGGNK